MLSAGKSGSGVWFCYIMNYLIHVLSSIKGGANDLLNNKLVDS